jgi:hypothetical protein
MKVSLASLFAPVDNETMKELVAEVKETIAVDADLTKKASLKLVDLWKIERSKKSASETFAQRRNYIRFI